MKGVKETVIVVPYFNFRDKKREVLLIYRYNKETLSYMSDEF